MPKKRFLNDEFYDRQTRVNVTGMEDISEVQEKVAKACITAGYAYIQLYDKERKFIKTWSECKKLPDEYFQEETGFSITVVLRPSPNSSKETSKTDLLEAGTFLY
jgi:hypothetical protein